MIKQFSFILIASITNVLCFSQEITRCQVVDAVLKFDKANEIFFFKKNDRVPIVFVDVDTLLKDCKFKDYYGRKVEVAHDSSYLQIANESNITVKGIQKIGNLQKIWLFYASANAFFTFVIKRKAGKVIVVSYYGGHI
jgi:hypothetical protein